MNEYNRIKIEFELNLSLLVMAMKPCMMYQGETMHGAECITSEFQSEIYHFKSIWWILSAKTI